MSRRCSDLYFCQPGCSRIPPEERFGVWWRQDCFFNSGSHISPLTPYPCPHKKENQTQKKKKRNKNTDKKEKIIGFCICAFWKDLNMVRADVQREPWKSRPSPELTETLVRAALAFPWAEDQRPCIVANESRTWDEPEKEKWAENLYNQWMCFFG